MRLYAPEHTAALCPHRWVWGVHGVVVLECLLLGFTFTRVLLCLRTPRLHSGSGAAQQCSHCRPTAADAEPGALSPSPCPFCAAARACTPTPAGQTWTPQPPLHPSPRSRPRRSSTASWQQGMRCTSPLAGGTTSRPPHAPSQSAGGGADCSAAMRATHRALQHAALRVWCTASALGARALRLPLPPCMPATSFATHCSRAPSAACWNTLCGALPAAAPRSPTALHTPPSVSLLGTSRACERHGR